MNFQLIFGLALCVVQALVLVSLLRHARAASSSAGASSVGEAVWVAGSTGWIVYALGTNSMVLVISGSLGVLGSASVLVLLWKWFPVRERVSALIAWGLVFSALAGSLWIGGIAGLSVGLAVFGVVQFLPQAVTLVRRWGHPVPGVSTRASLLRTSNMLSWAVYAGAWALAGQGSYDWPLIAWGLAGTAVFALTTINAARTSRVEDVTPVPVAV